jgi:putative ABC transport system permease protein
MLATDDDRPGCRPVAVASHGFWQRYLGGDGAAVSRAITLASQPVTIVGVAASRFFGLEVGRSFDIALPICSHEQLGGERGWRGDRSTWWLTVMGRLIPGQTAAAASARLEALSPSLFAATRPAQLQAQDAENYLALKLRAAPASAGVSALRTRYGDPLALLLGATALVLAIACANLASLMLARAAARERELALRLAVGATWWRLAQQVMVESALVAIAGGVAGLALAGALGQSLVALLGPGLFLELPFDGRIVVFTLAVTTLTCLAFGLLPAWRVSRVAALEATKASSRTATGGRAHARWRQTLVVGQVAVSLVLLFGALLFAGTMRNLLAVDVGFAAGDVTIVRVNLTAARGVRRARASLVNDVGERLRRMAGIVAAAEVRHVPLSGTGTSLRVWPDGRDGRERTAVRLNAVGSGYVAAMGIDLIAGRDFDARDSATSPPVALVNRSFTERLGIAGNPVGARFLAEGEGPQQARRFEIVGLVADTKYFTLREDFLPIVFVPIAQIDDPRPFTDFVVRAATSADPGAITRALESAGLAIAPEVRPFAATLRAGLLRERLMATISAFFGGLATLIAVVGLYGVMSYLVVRRRKEIGVRAALGAGRHRILRMIMVEAGSLLAAGLVLGTLLALLAARFAQSMLFGLSPHDPASAAVAATVLAAAALAASYLPARRAARMSPIAALRDE